MMGVADLTHAYELFSAFYRDFKVIDDNLAE